MDSLATLDLPAYGYGIRYQFGIFRQRVTDMVEFEAFAPATPGRSPGPTAR